MPRARWFSQFLTISVWFSIDAAASPSPLSSRASRPRPVFPFYPMARLPQALFVSHYSLASLLRRLSRCRPRFLVAVLVETMRVRFHNIEQSFISGFEGRGCTRGGKEIEQERESKTWDNYSMLPEPRHAGWILPVWLLKIIGSSHLERERKEGSLHTCICRVCACVRVWETWPYDSRIPIRWFMHVTFMDQYVGERKYRERNSWVPSTRRWLLYTLYLFT